MLAATRKGSRQDLWACRKRTRRYSIEIEDATGRSVWFAAADWTDEERRIAIAQNSRLCGMPDENCFTEALKKPTKPAKN